MSDPLGLYPHNLEAYNKIKEALKKDNAAAIVHATGTGKAYIGLNYSLENKDKRILYIAPYNSVIEHIDKIVENNPNISNEDFNHVSFKTYASFIKMDYDEIKKLKADTIILDEFHHIGAPIWGDKINKIIDTHPNAKIIGMTAYTIRDRGTSYERDMINEKTNELFSNKVVSRYDLCDAFIDGVLPKPVYKSAYIKLTELLNEAEDKLECFNKNTNIYTNYSKVLKDIKKRIHEAPSISEVFKRNIKKNGKYIYFCPINTEKGVNDIDTIQNEVRKWLFEIGLEEKDYIFYTSTSSMGEDGKENRDAFYNDEDLNYDDVSKKLRIMFAMNQYNEGTHVPNIDGVIMGRTTQSDIVYFEQMGRALSVRGNTKESIEYYESMSLDELKKTLEYRKIPVKDHYTKYDIIQLLVAPTIIDLANNIDFIKELEDNLKDRLRQAVERCNGTRIVHISNASFDIEMLNEDLYHILKDFYNKVSSTWEERYELAKSYYEHYGNLEIKMGFKTLNGYDYDENGVDLGSWISNIRSNYKNYPLSISKEHKEKLLAIGMRFEVKDHEEVWNKMYELAKSYYEYHGDLLVPTSFKTINGYEYDENGVKLGRWLFSQRKLLTEFKDKPFSKERIERLNAINMAWNLIDEKWYRNYKLLKVYYEHYGDLYVPPFFRTKNGYEYDENGYQIGQFVRTMRCAKMGKINRILTQEQIDKLEEIGMDWNPLDKKWAHKYELLKIYKEHHGDLEIPTNFRTINGYEYDENGEKLGRWLLDKKISYIGKNACSLNYDRIKALDNLEINWFDKETDYKFQSEIINESNSSRKQKEITNRFYSSITKYGDDSLPSKEEINDNFKKILKYHKSTD